MLKMPCNEIRPSMVKVIFKIYFYIELRYVASILGLSCMQNVACGIILPVAFLHFLNLSVSKRCICVKEVDLAKAKRDSVRLWFML